MSGLRVLSAGPGLTVQDLGRPGLRGVGVSPGGAADRRALAEGAALLAHPVDRAALEMAGFGGKFRAEQELRIALTGAPMRATLEGAPLLWNASHTVPAGTTLEIGAATSGVYGYLHLGGGINVPERLGARSTHLLCRIGAPLTQGDLLLAGRDPAPDHPPMTLPSEARFSGGTLRAVKSIQTHRFSATELARFQATAFRRDPRGNRMGVRLAHDGEGFSADGQLNVLSEIILAGDIQIAGDGSPFILLSEHQTTGGYPRIATVVPQDLPIVAQAPPGAPLEIKLMSREAALEDLRVQARALTQLAEMAAPLVRDPAAMRDLLSYQLISGAITGRDL